MIELLVERVEYDGRDGAGHGGLPPDRHQGFGGRIGPSSNSSNGRIEHDHDEDEPPVTVAGGAALLARGRGGRKEWRRRGGSRFARRSRTAGGPLDGPGACGSRELIREGVVTDYAELARLGHVTRARVTQIMNLLHLAPDIQETLLFLPAGRART